VSNMSESYAKSCTHVTIRNLKTSYCTKLIYYWLKAFY